MSKTTRADMPGDWSDMSPDDMKAAVPKVVPATSIPLEPGADYHDDYDEPDGPELGEECGRWRNGKLSRYCAKAGTEECDWECPYR